MRQTGDRYGTALSRRQPSLRRCRAWLALASGLWLLTGCQQDGRLAVNDRDPLVGSQAPLPPTTPPPPAARVTSNPLPPA
ncbi:MAG TPA: hypothetical protein VFA18_02730, partial [Gemmataceae bacterium]|nr:hypothetical protein [Gemmataceae bacterium]